MAENLSIRVLGESESPEDSWGNSAAIIGLELDILGEVVDIRISAAQRQATLADIVPLARILSTKFVSAVVDKLRKEQKSVACCKGCSACCRHCLVPLSVPEVFRMMQEVLDMPADQSKAILQSCLDAAKTILDGKLESFDLNSSTTNDPTDVSQLGSWYAGLKLPCPFLSGGLCTIYEQRPTACREHLVTDSALLCETKPTDEPNVVMMPVSVVEALGQLASELEGTGVVEAIILPLALPWAQENLQRHQRTWPAIMMVERFVDILQETASKKSAVTPTPA
ncbi:MAG: YkgJ family cysteine cluster protein [Planctomycetota bacterium]|jgi:Fe-S-cluster containining protein